jgi:pyroglutamyl-peptidase
MGDRPDPHPTVLLTGFGPFPGITVNASTALVKGLARSARQAIPDFRFIAAILPTDWDRAPPTIARLHRRHAPVLALHFGVAASARGFRIETEARNICHASRDAAGNLPAASRLMAEGADVCPVTVSAPMLAAALQAKGYPVSLSDNAGGYLCNAVLYHSLTIAGGPGRNCQVGFVHIPADVSRPPLTLTGAIAGAFEIVKEALASLTINSPPR